MQPPPSNNIITRISKESNIDLRRASGKQSLFVYNLALQQISEILKTDVQTIPESSLQEIKETLNTIRVGFLDMMRSEDIEADFARSIEYATPLINEALSNIVTAITILDGKDVSSEYYNLLFKSSEKINQILGIFDAYPIFSSRKFNSQRPQPIADEINPISINTQPTTESDTSETPDGSTTPSTNTQSTPDSSNIIGIIEQKAGTTEKNNEQVEIAIRAIADNPSEVDLLEFSDYAIALVDFIENENTEKPLTIVIDAPWGMGKSTLMGLMKSELKTRAKANKQRPFPTVWFNAWKYDQESSLWAALALEILGQVRKQFNVWRRFKLSTTLTIKRLDRDIIFNALFKTLPYIIGLILIVGIILLVASLWLGSSFLGSMQKYIASIGILGAITVAYAFAKDIYGKVKPLDQKISKYIHAPSYYIRTPNYKDKIGFLAEFEEDFKLVVASVTDDGRRPLIIFIDDLDRCAPPKPVEIIEAINILLDSQSCVFVIGMDSQTVAGSIEAKYKDLQDYLKVVDDPGGLTLGERFLEKIVQINFHIPRPDPEVVKKFIEKNLKAGRVQGTGIQPINQSEEVKETEGLIKDELRTGKTLDEAAQTVQSARPDIRVDLVEQAKQGVFAKTFDDSEDVKNAIQEAALYLGYNPRKIKRFINVFRLQALIANRRGLLETGAIELLLLAKWITIVTRWPDMVDAILIDQNFLKSLKDAFLASEELSLSDDVYLASEEGRKKKAKFDRYLTNPHIDHLIYAKDLVNLLKQTSDTETEALPKYLQLTQTTIGASIDGEQLSSSVLSQQAKQ